MGIPGVSDLDRELHVARGIAKRGVDDGTTVPLLEFLRTLRDENGGLLAKAVQHVGEREFLEPRRLAAHALIESGALADVAALILTALSADSRFRLEQ